VFAVFVLLVCVFGAFVEEVLFAFFQILAVGNFMNNSAASAAQGFDLFFLSKLADTKSVNEKSTLLHYIALLADRNQLHVSKKGKFFVLLF
jgi:hypothetical protein